MTRESGVLLHITSLPGGEGIGDLGAAARRFIDWLAEAKQRWWQMLPCGEVGYGGSPYQSRSAYAGNPMLISLEALVDDGLMDPERLKPCWVNTRLVDFERTEVIKTTALRRVCEDFMHRADDELKANFRRYCRSSDQHWLQDYARFAVIKARFGDRPWYEWPDEFAHRSEAALEELDREEDASLEAVKITQFLFARQWSELRTYARRNNLRLLGDCPIYVASDSADVWSYPELFDLNEEGAPRVVAGVPPDYFSSTGQLWGNPIYLWERCAGDDYAWWRARLKHCAQQFDLTRLDHFRGLEAYWEVPADAPDSSYGRWQPGPGAAFLESLAQDYDSLPLVAEDLGDLTQAVHELRAQFALPGMRVMQFGFDGGDDNPHEPERIVSDCICYAGTHDNNTTLGWLKELDPQQLESLRRRYPAESLSSLLDYILDEVLASPAKLAVLTMQDLLRLSSEARFNTPGTVGNNWRWRLGDDDLSTELASSLAERTRLAERSTQPVGAAMSRG